MKNKGNHHDILLLIDNNFELVGGGIVSIKIILEGVKEKFSIGLIQPGSIKNNKNPYKIYELSKYKRIKELIKNPFTFIKYIYDVFKIIKQTKPKIIHTQEQVSFFIVALLKKLKLIKEDICLIHTDRGLYTKYGKIIRAIFMFFINELDYFITTTNFNMKYWKEKITTKYKNIKFKVIENAAGKMFETLDENKLKDNSKPIVIGFAGRYTDWKNWPLAEKICMNLLEKTDIDFKIHMAVGCLEDNALKKTKQMFNRLKNKLGNRFVGEINLDIEEMDQFYYGIDIFILTSKFNTESFGRTLIEAMSRKTIVLTTNAGGSVEVVGNMENVCNTVDEFIKRISYFYYNKKAFEDEKENNLARVREKYTQKNNVVKHIELYEKILKQFY